MPHRQPRPKAGDIAVIKHPTGTFRGPIQSVSNMGTVEEPNWYIEFTHDALSHARTGDPGYWKQRIDGGTVSFIPQEVADA
jgi:hypothetical protein